jgi:Ran GTPase-activating protein (RanGAP) involved in mRNA processing and transport
VCSLSQAIKQLVLPNNDAGVEELVELVACFPSLQVLDLSGSALGVGGATALAQAWAQRGSAGELQELKLQRSKLGDAGALVLLRALQDGACPLLEKLVMLFGRADAC